MQPILFFCVKSFKSAVDLAYFRICLRRLDGQQLQINHQIYLKNLEIIFLTRKCYLVKKSFLTSPLSLHIFATRPILNGWKQSILKYMCVFSDRIYVFRLHHNCIEVCGVSFSFSLILWYKKKNERVKEKNLVSTSLNHSAMSWSGGSINCDGRILTNRLASMRYK